MLNKPHALNTYYTLTSCKSEKLMFIEFCDIYINLNAE